ncbi:MAG TPA: response regulator transcription factor [Anaerolineales bacterium]
MSLIRTLLVDDSPDFLDAAAHFLSSDPQIEIVGVSLSGQEALDRLPGIDPDLVLMDLAMPDLSGLEATRRIKTQPNAPRVIILTLHDNQEYRRASQAAQADGFMTKSDVGVNLLPLIHSLFELEVPVSK